MIVAQHNHRREAIRDYSALLARICRWCGRLRPRRQISAVGRPQPRLPPRPLVVVVIADGMTTAPTCRAGCTPLPWVTVAISDCLRPAPLPAPAGAGVSHPGTDAAFPRSRPDRSLPVQYALEVDRPRATSAPRTPGTRQCACWLRSARRTLGDEPALLAC
jgi:hypothetical protein